MKKGYDTLNTIKTIQASAKHLPEPRVIQGMKVGEVVRQGDIYVERIAAIEGKGGAVASRQLAPGTTKGSRHIVAESAGVKLWVSKPTLGGKSAFQVGPAIECKGDLTITHPEHAWLKIVGGKVAQLFQVWFQADWSRKARVQD